MTYFVSLCIRAVGLSVRTVRSAFHVARSGTSVPSVLSRTVTPDDADPSMGWLNVTTTSCHGPPYSHAPSGTIESTAGEIVVNDERKSLSSTPSAADVSPFFTRIL